MSNQYPEDDEDEEGGHKSQGSDSTAASSGDLKDRLSSSCPPPPGKETSPQENLNNGDAHGLGAVGFSNVDSLPFGGARPKTRLIPLDPRTKRLDEEVRRGGEERGAELRKRLSECEVNVQSCDNYNEREESVERVSNGRGKDRGSTFGRVESRGELRGLNRNERIGWNSLPDDAEGGEDEFCIYTYKGGTAYLTADLPNSFFRLIV